jgi:hypothetical protein
MLAVGVFWFCSTVCSCAVQFDKKSFVLPRILFAAVGKITTGIFAGQHQLIKKASAGTLALRFATMRRG